MLSINNVVSSSRDCDIDIVKRARGAAAKKAKVGAMWKNTRGTFVVPVYENPLNRCNARLHANSTAKEHKCIYIFQSGATWE
jgi:hypothetical protein